MLFLAFTAILAYPVAARAAAHELAVFSPRTGRALLALPAARVRGLKLTLLHSYDRVPVSEDFAVEHGRLWPVSVAYASDTYDYRDTRYPACRRRVLGGRTVLDRIRPGADGGYRAIRGRVAHGPTQRLDVTLAGGETLHLDLGDLGPGGTPYTIILRETPTDHEPPTHASR